MFQQKCKLCNKERGQHKAKTLECPVGKRTRIGHTTYSSDQTFVPKATRKKKDTFQL
jgi:hypothetical protein